MPRPKSSMPQLLRDDSEALRPELAQRADAVLGDAAEAEAAGEQGRAVRDVGACLAGGGVDLVHGKGNVVEPEVWVQRLG